MALSNQELARIKKYSGNTDGRSIKQAIKQSQQWEESDENKRLLEDCWQDWVNMCGLRKEHLRNQRYKNGHQWDDLITDPDDPNKLIRESEYISRQGRSAIQNNLIQQIDRNIQGQMISNPTQPVVISRSADDISLSEMLTNTLQKGLQINKYNTLKVSEFESLLSAGLCVAKVRYGVWDTKNRSDVKIDFININRFFFNQDAESPKLDDVYRLGEIHDLTWNQLLRDFYTGRRDDEQALREQYAANEEHYRSQLSDNAPNNIRSLDFYGVANSGKYRVYEIWYKRTRKVELVHDKAKGEEIFDEVNGWQYYEAENRVRREQMESFGLPEDIIESRLIEHRTIVEEYWEARWLTPNGTCLKKMETPYAHQQHPYVIGSMPRIDGVTKPVFSHLCDMQRTINRHLTLVDYALAHAAKGCLLVPSSMLQMHTLEDISSEYAKTDGVLVYDDTKVTPQKPTQLSSSAIPAGTFEFLNAEMSNLREVSGLSGALSGQVAKNGTPSSLYAQQAQNSMLNFVLVFDCFKDFNTEVAEKVLQTQMQYYTTRRHVDVSGQTYNQTAIYYEPTMIDKIVDWNIVVTDATDTPVFRQLGDELLRFLFESKAINVEMLLENSSAPFAQKLLAQIRSAQQQAQQGDIQGAAAAVGNIDNQELQQQLGASATPQSLAAVQEAYNNMTNADIRQSNIS